MRKKSHYSKDKVLFIRCDKYYMKAHRDYLLVFIFFGIFSHNESGKQKEKLLFYEELSTDISFGQYRKQYLLLPTQMDAPAQCSYGKLFLSCIGPLASVLIRISGFD